MRVILLAAIVLGASAFLGPATARAAVACDAPAGDLFEVTSATGMTCRAAREDLDAYEGRTAVSFKTPGGYTCSRTAKKTREQVYRCVKGTRSYRASLFGRIRSAVRVYGKAFDSVFTLSKCSSDGESDLTASGTAAGGVKTTITAMTLSLGGGSEEDGVNAEGTISSLEVGDDGTITARGTFTSGLDGTFRLKGECVA